MSSPLIAAVVAAYALVAGSAVAIAIIAICLVAHLRAEPGPSAAEEATP